MLKSFNPPSTATPSSFNSNNNTAILSTDDTGIGIGIGIGGIGGGTSTTQLQILIPDPILHYCDLPVDQYDKIITGLKLAYTSYVKYESRYYKDIAEQLKRWADMELNADYKQQQAQAQIASNTQNNNSSTGTISSDNATSTTTNTSTNESLVDNNGNILWYGSEWYACVGSSFGSYISWENGHCIYASIGQLKVLLWRHG
jgi:hypothetical protein